MEFKTIRNQGLECKIPGMCDVSYRDGILIAASPEWNVSVQVEREPADVFVKLMRDGILNRPIYDDTGRRLHVIRRGPTVRGLNGLELVVEVERTPGGGLQHFWELLLDISRDDVLYIKLHAHAPFEEWETTWQDVIDSIRLYPSAP